MSQKNMTPHDYRTFLSGVITGLEFARSTSMQLDRNKATDDEDCGCGKKKDAPLPTEDELPPGFKHG